jgi:hypothetical protein
MRDFGDILIIAAIAGAVLYFLSLRGEEKTPAPEIRTFENQTIQAI